MPWAVLSALGLAWLYRQGFAWVKRVKAEWANGYAGLAAVLFGFFFVLCGGYAWLVFVQTFPEYALTYPQHKSPLYASLSNQRQGEAFGFPHQSGWKTIGYLYRIGCAARPV